MYQELQRTCKAIVFSLNLLFGDVLVAICCPCRRVWRNVPSSQMCAILYPTRARGIIVNYTSLHL